MFKKWFLLTNPTSGSMVENSFKWYHISTRGINHTRRWFHKWSSTLSDHKMKNASITYKSSSLSSEWSMLWHRERCPTDWYQGQRSYVWYLKSYTSGVIPTYEVVSITNARGSNIEECEGIKILGQEKHKVGGASSWTWLFAFDMCIFMCLFALHKF
jgi:hypothetical protein